MKILIIDDDPQNREIVRARLEQAGYEVSEATNGEEGLELAIQEKCDLIILDVMMPKKDGWQVCKAIKSHPKIKDIPVVILTARIQGIDELRSWECGADEYITKPVDHIQLLEVVGKLVGGHSERSEESQK